MTLIDWHISEHPVAYEHAVAEMENRVAAIRAGTAAERIWLLEHPALYTAGSSADDRDLLVADRLPVYRTGRGGQYTYHGPGQRVVYVMLDLKRRGGDVRAFVHALEDWAIAALAQFNVHGERRADRVGVWVARPDLSAGHEAKIAAIGVRVRRWVTYHGVAINVDPDLRHYDGIVPCGIADYAVTSLMDLGVPATLADLDVALRATFDDQFGPQNAPGET